ncbi:hypothetical protein SteCoe_35734 [Stentor coeruleus]|uniref:Uncharacterized protein n=1 Tax=Stentor coeruleus TaxID=5963 RepID=A0A1R2ARM3_9CILI|nr:hypothetical protein SteCoe_35734 [Stentor coeruleus]
MLRNNEAKPYKLHYSPDQSSSNIEKLSFLQQNLSLASETIQALKQERDQLKDSLRNSIEESKYKKQLQDLDQSSNSIENFSIESRKKKALKAELQNLKKIAMEKDKMIQAMEKKFKDQKQDKKHLKSLNEKLSLSTSDINDKEKYIQMLEKRFREQSIELEKKVSEEDYMNIKSQLKEKTLALESLGSSLKDLISEKSYWKKLYDFFAELVPESLENDKHKSLDKSSWQKFSEVLLSLKDSNTEKDLIIESLTEKMKKLIAKGQEKASDSKNYPNQSDKFQTFGLGGIKNSTENIGLLNEIQEMVHIIIEKVHLNSQIHDHFKSRLVCSKRFRSMIENQEFPESLLRVMKLLIDILDYNFTIISAKNVYQNESQTPDFTISHKGQRKKSSEKSHQITSWTQTNNDKTMSQKKVPMLQIGDFDENYDKHNRSIQTSFDTREVKFSKTWGQVSTKNSQGKHIVQDSSDSSYNARSSNKDSLGHIKIQENMHDYQQKSGQGRDKSPKNPKNSLSGHKKNHIENDPRKLNKKQNLYKNPSDSPYQSLKKNSVNKVQHTNMSIKNYNKEGKYDTKNYESHNRDYESFSRHQDSYYNPYTSNSHKDLHHNTRPIRSEDSSLEGHHKKYLSPDSHYENFHMSISGTESSYEEVPRPISSIPNRVPSPKKNLDLTLFDESHHLLKIINKQNTRLAKINNQISQLVPNNSFTTGEKDEFEYSNFIDHNNSERSFKSMKYRIPKDRVYIDSDAESYDEASEDMEYENGEFISQGSRSKKVFNNRKYVKVQKKDRSVSRSKSKTPLRTKANNYDEIKGLKSSLSTERSYPNLENSQKLKSSLKRKTPNRHNDERKRDKSSGRHGIEDSHKARSPLKANDESRIGRNSIKISKDRGERSRSPPLNDGSFRDLSTSKRHKSPEEFDNSFEYYENASNRDDANEREDFKGFSEQNSPRKERKRSGWDLSALKIPSKEPQETRIPEISKKITVSPRKEGKSLEEKKKNDRSKSPEVDKNRFREYTRPMLREEKCWDSVSDFFTGKKAEEKPKEQISS